MADEGLGNEEVFDGWKIPLGVGLRGSCGNID